MKDLFDKEVKHPKLVVRKRKNLFSEYDVFVDKFKRKNTTDECYTPPEVYECVLNYVRRKVDITGMEVIRPFYPENDYRDMNYYSNQVVIDNPPFSIISQIARFYNDNGIKYFLFAPHLTLFSANTDNTEIVAGADIEYENGAVVKTSFLTNMFGDIAVIGDAELYNELMTIKDKNKKPSLPKYQYPENVLTVSNLHKLVIRGVSISFKKSEVQFVSVLDSQKKHNKKLFGSGYLISDKAKQRKEKAKAEAKAEVFVFELSDRERQIIEEMNNNDFHQK